MYKDDAGTWNGTAIRYGYGFSSRVKIDRNGNFSSDLPK
jgi:hypothetical protein